MRLLALTSTEGPRNRCARAVRTAAADVRADVHGRPRAAVAAAALLLTIACTSPQNAPAGGSGGGGGGRRNGGSGGATGGAGAAEPVPPATGDGPIAGPLPSCVVGVRPLQKLSSLQLGNAVRDLLKASGADFALDAAETALFALPPDVRDGTFHELDDRTSLNHVAAGYAVAAAVADAITSSPEHVAAVVGACATKGLRGACLGDFVARFGRRVHRRPLTDDERQRYVDVVTSATDSTSGLRDAIARMLMAPEFLYHFETNGRAFAKDEHVLRLTAFEVASRLSFLFWRSAPDDALLDAAEGGALDTEEGFRAAVDRVFDDPRTRETMWGFYRQWFKLEGFLGFLMKNRFLASFAAGLGFEDANGHQYEDMVDEIHALTDRVTWQTKGGTRELLTTDVAPSRSPLLAKLYGVAAYDGNGDPPRLPANERAGLLTRAAFLVSGDERTSPIHRGGFIRRSILCDDLAPPDPNSLPAGALVPPAPAPGSTTRQRFTAKTADARCMACHKQMNDIGYVLEAYDALGRFRTAEKIYDDQGKLKDTVPIDTAATPRIVATDDAVVRTPVDLSRAIADSGKVESCFARQSFRFAERRMDDDPADACLVDAVTASLSRNGGSLSDAFKQLALAPSFRTRRTPAP